MSLRHGRFAGYGKIEADFRAGFIQAKLIRNAIGRAPQLPRLGNCDMDTQSPFVSSGEFGSGACTQRYSTKESASFEISSSVCSNVSSSSLSRKLEYHEKSVEGSFGAEQLVTHIACGVARGKCAILQTFGLRVVHEVEKEQVRVSRRANEASIWPFGRPLDR